MWRYALTGLGFAVAIQVIQWADGNPDRATTLPALAVHLVVLSLVAAATGWVMEWRRRRSGR